MNNASVALGLCFQRWHLCGFEVHSWEPACGKIRASALLKTKSFQSRCPTPVVVSGERWRASIGNG